jgi:hypothetical protein
MEQKYDFPHEDGSVEGASAFSMSFALIPSVLMMGVVLDIPRVSLLSALSKLAGLSVLAISGKVLLMPKAILNWLLLLGCLLLLS